MNSTRKLSKNKLTARGTGRGKGLLVPSKLSYVAFQLQNTVGEIYVDEKQSTKNAITKL